MLTVATMEVETNDFLLAAANNTVNKTSTSQSPLQPITSIGLHNSDNVQSTTSLWHHKPSTSSSSASDQHSFESHAEGSEGENGGTSSNNRRQSSSTSSHDSDGGQRHDEGQLMSRISPTVGCDESGFKLNDKHVTDKFDGVVNSDGDPINKQMDYGMHKTTEDAGDYTNGGGDESMSEKEPILQVYREPARFANNHSTNDQIEAQYRENCPKFVNSNQFKQSIDSSPENIVDANNGINVGARNCRRSPKHKSSDTGPTRSPGANFDISPYLNMDQSNPSSINNSSQPPELSPMFAAAAMAALAGGRFPFNPPSTTTTTDHHHQQQLSAHSLLPDRPGLLDGSHFGNLVNPLTNPNFSAALTSLMNPMSANTSATGSNCYNNTANGSYRGGASRRAEPSDGELDEEYGEHGDEEDAGEVMSIDINHHPSGSGRGSNSGHHWTFEEQFKQLYVLSDDPKRKDFLDELFAYMQRRGTPVNRIPIMAKQVLDLYELFNLVVARGGLVEVINKKLWREITKGLNLPSSITSAAFTLRTQYMKYLYPFECERLGMSSPNELQSAIDGNRREARRSSYSLDYPPNSNTSRSGSPNNVEPNFSSSVLSNIGHSSNPASLSTNLLSFPSIGHLSSGPPPLGSMHNGIPQFTSANNNSQLHPFFSNISSQINQSGQLSVDNDQSRSSNFLQSPSNVPFTPTNTKDLPTAGFNPLQSIVAGLAAAAVTTNSESSGIGGQSTEQRSEASSESEPSRALAAAAAASLFGANFPKLPNPFATTLDALGSGQATTMTAGKVDADGSSPSDSSQDREAKTVKATRTDSTEPQGDEQRRKNNGNCVLNLATSIDSDIHQTPANLSCADKREMVTGSSESRERLSISTSQRFTDVKTRIGLPNSNHNRALDDSMSESRHVTKTTQSNNGQRSIDREVNGLQHSSSMTACQQMLAAAAAMSGQLGEMLSPDDLIALRSLGETQTDASMSRSGRPTTSPPSRKSTLQQPRSDQPPPSKMPKLTSPPPVGLHRVEHGRKTAGETEGKRHQSSDVQTNGHSTPSLAFPLQNFKMHTQSGVPMGLPQNAIVVSMELGQTLYQGVLFGQVKR